MNEKPLHLPMSFGDALQRLVRVPKAAVDRKSKNGASAPGAQKTLRASRVKRGKSR